MNQNSISPFENLNKQLISISKKFFDINLGKF